MKELRLGPLRLASPLFLSPMAGFTNLPFRVALRWLGGLSVATTDFVNARALLELAPRALRTVALCADDRPVGVQLFGAQGPELAEAARFLETLGVDFIDINLGCPSDKVTRGGAGAALMQDEELTEELLGHVVGAVRIPVTVKMRLGWDADSLNAHVIAPRLERMGVAAVAVHGRTKAQGYSGAVDVPAIRRVAEAVREIPVIGNGDVHDAASARRMLEEGGCRGVMVGRAALADPFFFRDTLRCLREGGEAPRRPAEHYAAFMHLHFCLALRYWGEEAACRQFRKVIPGYAEHFHRPARWGNGCQNLCAVEDYRGMLRELAPSREGWDLETTEAEAWRARLVELEAQSNRVGR